MGVVYKARQISVDRIVAIKMLNAQMAQDPSWVQRFYNEARACSQLQHPNTVRMFEFGLTASGRPFMAMEFLDGQSLRDLIARDAPLDPARVMRIVIQCCASLSEAHTARIIHRDIKPDNVILLRIANSPDFVKLLDFSVAKLLQDDRIRTQAGVVFGTPQYMSPEQARGLPLDSRADLYSLGILTFEMLTGQAPFFHENPMQVLQMHVREPIPALSSWSIPEPLHRFVEKSLAKEASLRFQTAHEMMRACEKSLSLLPTSSVANISSSASNSASASEVDDDDATTINLDTLPGVALSVEQIESGAPVDAKEYEDLLGDTYGLTRKLGEGGMGTVYLGRHLRLGRWVAIKLIRRKYSQDAQVVSRFLNEARAASRIPHPGITQVFDLGVHNGQAYFVMEYLDGESLSSYFKGRPYIPLKTISDICTKIADTIAAAHDAGIIHRDLKPDNIHILEDKSDPSLLRIKVLDFGIAKLLHTDRDEASITQAGAIMGTPSYMSPEQLLDAAHIDNRSDIYSLGCILFELVCGRRPFAGKGLMEMANAHLHNSPPRPSTLKPSIPPYLDSLVERMLAKDPDHRPQSMREVIKLLGKKAQQSDSNDKTMLALAGNGKNPAGPPPLPKGVEKPQRKTGFALSAMAHRRRRAASPPAMPDSFAAASAPPEITIFPASEGVLSSQQSSLALPVSRKADKDSMASSWDALDRVIPATMTEARTEIREFFCSLFAGATPRSPAIACLYGPKIDHAESYCFFALFVSDSTVSTQAPLGRLGTRTFVQCARTLDAHLEEVGDSQAVVIVVANSVELGPGVRERILEYRKKFGALVVPLYLGEIRRAHRNAQSRDLFIDRLQDFHTIPDPYAGGRTSIDATQFFGMRSILNELVQRIRGPGGLITVTGPPGSGKTSLVTMAEYGLEQRNFIYVHCAQTAERSLSALVQKISHAMPEPMELGEKSDINTVLKRVTLGLNLNQDKLPILVLDNADWLIKALVSPTAPRHEVDEIRRLWVSIAEHCESRGLTVVVTSMRGSVLSTRVLDGWDNPMRPYPINVPALTYRGLQQLIRELGVVINLRFKNSAIRAIYQLSGGNVYTARSLCSHIVRSLQAREEHHVLASAHVTAANVHEASDELASLSRTYEETVMSWLDEAEKQVLQHVALSAPYSSRLVQEQLGASMGAERVKKAFSSLQNVGLITARKKQGTLVRLPRHRLSVPLMERWFRLNTEEYLVRREHIKSRRIRRMTFGLVLTALLMGVYTTWLRTGRGITNSYNVDACSYQVDYPRHGAPQSELSVYVHRHCGAPSQKSWSVSPRSTAARIPTANTGNQDKMQCDAYFRYCFAEVSVVLLESALDEYEFVLIVEGHDTVFFKIEEDSFATIKQKFQGLFQVAALLPFILGLFLAFYKDVLAVIRRSMGLLGPENEIVQKDGKKPNSASS
ncbi:MAG: serine/threonine-protein kinase [Proteobacteria bacterium]|nr:serine/threonine-protein kinase [Pseudomonadota bacterium]